MFTLFRWRVGFYVAGEDGCVGNFMELLDEFLVWKPKTRENEHVKVRSFVVNLVCVDAVSVADQVHIYIQDGLKECDEEVIGKLK